MGFAIAETAVHNLMNIQSDCEYQVGLIVNTLQRLSMASASITMQQSTATQVYLEQHKDADGYIDQAAIEYANSEAFNAKFNSQLRAIKAKEQILNQQKMQLENRQRTAATEVEGWSKLSTNIIGKTFKYFN